MSEPETTTAEINGSPARILRPLGDTRPARQLPLVEAPALLFWGEQDRFMPLGYARRFAGRKHGGLDPQIANIKKSIAFREPRAGSKLGLSHCRVLPSGRWCGSAPSRPPD